MEKKNDIVTQKCVERWSAGSFPQSVDRQMTCQYGKCPTTKNLYLKGQFTKLIEKHTFSVTLRISNNSIQRWFWLENEKFSVTVDVTVKNFLLEITTEEGCGSSGVIRTLFKCDCNKKRLRVRHHNNLSFSRFS